MMITTRTAAISSVSCASWIERATNTDCRRPMWIRTPGGSAG